MKLTVPQHMIVDDRNVMQYEKGILADLHLAAKHFNGSPGSPLSYNIEIGLVIARGICLIRAQQALVIGVEDLNAKIEKRALEAEDRCAALMSATIDAEKRMDEAERLVTKLSAHIAESYTQDFNAMQE